MFNIGWSELLLIGIVALVAVGPKELPGVLRMAAQWIGKARRMASEFQGQFQEALREAELTETANELRSAVKSATEGTDLDLGLKDITRIEDKSADEVPSTPAPAAADGESGEKAEAPKPVYGSSPDDWPAPSEDFVITPAPKGTHPSWNTEKTAEAGESTGTAATPPASDVTSDTAASPAAPSGEKAAG